MNTHYNNANNSTNSRISNVQQPRNNFQGRSIWNSQTNTSSRTYLNEHYEKTVKLNKLFREDNFSEFKKVLESGYDVNYVPPFTWHTHLILNSICGYSVKHAPKYVSYLLQRGANPNIVSRDNQRCPLKVALIRSMNFNYAIKLQIVKILLENGATPNFPPAIDNHPVWGLVYTPLFQAAHKCLLYDKLIKGSTAMIEVLLKHGCQDIRNKNGRTALEAIKHSLTQKMAPYCSPKHYSNFDKIEKLLTMGAKGYQVKLKQEKEAEQRSQKELQRQKELQKQVAKENNLTNSHVTHLLSLDQFKKCKKEALKQHTLNTMNTTLQCTPQSFIETKLKGRPVGFTECDKQGAKHNNLVLNSSIKKCETEQIARQKKSEMETMSIRRSSKSNNNNAPQGRAQNSKPTHPKGSKTSKNPSRPKNLTEKEKKRLKRLKELEKRTDELYKRLKALTLEIREATKDMTPQEARRLRIDLFSRLSQENNLSQLNKLHKGNIPLHVIDNLTKSRRSLHRARAEGRRLADTPTETLLAEAKAKAQAKSIERQSRRNNSSNSRNKDYYNYSYSTSFISDNRRRRSMSDPSSVKRLGRLVTGTVTLEDGQVVSNNKTTWTPSVGYEN